MPASRSTWRTCSPGAGVRLSDDVLDKIDEIVPPGVNLRQGDTYYTPPAVADKRLRRL